MLTFTVSVRRTVEEDIDFEVQTDDVNLAVDEALARAKQGYDRTKVIVHADVVGNIHDNEGGVWI